MRYRGRSRWVRRNDRQYHNNQHVKHAAINVWHVILGGIVLVSLLICICG